MPDRRDKEADGDGATFPRVEIRRGKEEIEGESATTKGKRQREGKKRRETGESIAAAIPCKGVMILLGSGIHGSRLRARMRTGVGGNGSRWHFPLPLSRRQWAEERSSARRPALADTLTH